MSKLSFLITTGLLISTNTFASQCPTPQGFEASNNGMEWNTASKPVTLVNLWAVWCPPCLKELPMLDQIADHDSFAIDTVHLGDNPNAIKDRFNELKIQNLPDTIEPNFGKLQQWGFQGLPATMVVVDHQVKYRYSGYIRHDANTLETWLECLSQEEKQG